MKDRAPEIHRRIPPQVKLGQSVVAHCTILIVAQSCGRCHLFCGLATHIPYCLHDVEEKIIHQTSPPSSTLPQGPVLMLTCQSFGCVPFGHQLHRPSHSKLQCTVCVPAFYQSHHSLFFSIFS